LDTIVTRLAVEETSALGSRGATLADKIESNAERIEFLTARLAQQRERLLSQFFHLETVIARFQSNLSALSNLQIIPPRGSTNTTPLDGR
jgi:flagellar capping protein FliD